MLSNHLRDVWIGLRQYLCGLTTHQHMIFTAFTRSCMMSASSMTSPYLVTWRSAASRGTRTRSHLIMFSYKLGDLKRSCANTPLSKSMWALDNKRPCESKRACIDSNCSTSEPVLPPLITPTTQAYQTITDSKCHYLL